MNSTPYYNLLPFEIQAIKCNMFPFKFGNLVMPINHGIQYTMSNCSLHDVYSHFMNEELVNLIVIGNS